MTPRQFFELVVAMREAQQRYFRTRTQKALSDSKSLESRVDSEISRVQAIIAKDQKPDVTLFNQDDNGNQ